MVRVDENGYPVIFEARSLAENQMYEFWVSASTSVGEGEPTSVIAQATNTRGRQSQINILNKQNNSFELMHSKRKK